MKKTAIQQAIAVVRSRIDSIDETLMGKHTIHHLQQVERLLHQLLEAEKEQIIASYWDGCRNWDNEKEAEEYYKQTYENESRYIHVPGDKLSPQRKML
jgi:hypothetical protein